MTCYSYEEAMRCGNVCTGRKYSPLTNLTEFSVCCLASSEVHSVTTVPADPSISSSAVATFGSTSVAPAASVGFGDLPAVRMTFLRTKWLWRS